MSGKVILIGSGTRRTWSSVSISALLLLGSSQRYSSPANKPWSFRSPKVPSPGKIVSQGTCTRSLSRSTFSSVVTASVPSCFARLMILRICHLAPWLSLTVAAMINLLRSGWLFKVTFALLRWSHSGCPSSTKPMNPPSYPAAISMPFTFNAKLPHRPP